jgi:hypothetical protein
LKVEEHKESKGNKRSWGNNIEAKSHVENKNLSMYFLFKYFKNKRFKYYISYFLGKKLWSLHPKNTKYILFKFSRKVKVFFFFFFFFFFFSNFGSLRYIDYYLFFIFIFFQCVTQHLQVYSQQSLPSIIMSLLHIGLTLPFLINLFTFPRMSHL